MNKIIFNKNIIEPVLLFICFIIYFSWYSSHIYGPNYNPTNVSNVEIGLGIFGFICGIWLSVYLRRKVFNDNSDVKNIWFIIFIGLIGILTMSFSIIAIIYNVKSVNNSDWTKYHQLLFPLYGGLILISEESVRHFIHYILNEKNYTKGRLFRRRDIVNLDSNSSTPMSDSSTPNSPGMAIRDPGFKLPIDELESITRSSTPDPYPSSFF